MKYSDSFYQLLGGYIIPFSVLFLFGLITLFKGINKKERETVKSGIWLITMGFIPIGNFLLLYGGIFVLFFGILIKTYEYVLYKLTKDYD